MIHLQAKWVIPSWRVGLYTPSFKRLGGRGVLTRNVSSKDGPKGGLLYTQPTALFCVFLFQGIMEKYLEK